MPINKVKVVTKSIDNQPVLLKSDGAYRLVSEADNLALFKGFIQVSKYSEIKIDVPMRFIDMVTHLEKHGVNIAGDTINTDTMVYAQIAVTYNAHREGGLGVLTVYPYEQDTGARLLEAGKCYFITEKNHEEILLEVPRKDTSSIILNESDDILEDEVKTFFQVKMPGRKNKKGILMFGPGGNGKTSAIMRLAEKAKEFDAVTFYIKKGVELTGYFMENFKRIMDGRNVIFVLEELTERMREVESLLTFLDGENSWDNSVVIATTNYPEELPANIIDRPGRFELILEYKNPSNKNIEDLAKLFGFTPEDAEILKGKDLSYDYASFLLSKAKATGATVAEVYKAESDKRSRVSSTFKGKLGF